MKNLMLTLALVLAISTTWAQPPGGGRPDKFDHEQFKANKVAFITLALNLKPAEAEKFWPIYNQMENERNKIFEERRNLEQLIVDQSDNLSDKEYVELSRKFASIFKKESDLNTKYNEDFLKILPPKKVVELYKAEYNFRKDLLRKFKNDRENRK